jgi:uncharacterized membrane protein
MPDHAVVTDAAWMTNPSPTRSSYGEPSHYNVLAISFEDDQNAFGALTKLQELDTQGQVAVQEAMIVRRADDGNIEVKDRIGTTDLPGTATGGILGLLVGILGGPVGVLVGGYSGLVLGSLADLDESEHVETALGEMSKSVEPNRNSVLAAIGEQSPEVVDVAMASFGGTVLRRSVEDVEAEVAAAAKAERKAAREAQLELIQGKRDHTRESAHAKVEELKAKGSRGSGDQATEPTGGAA